jgi:hypothetical protein
MPIATCLVERHRLVRGTTPSRKARPEARNSEAAAAKPGVAFAARIGHR